MRPSPSPLSPLRPGCRGDGFTARTTYAPRSSGCGRMSADLRRQRSPTSGRAWPRSVSGSTPRGLRSLCSGTRTPSSVIRLLVLTENSALDADRPIPPPGGPKFCDGDMSTTHRPLHRRPSETPARDNGTLRYSAPCASRPAHERYRAHRPQVRRLPGAS